MKIANANNKRMPREPAKVGGPRAERWKCEKGQFDHMNCIVRGKSQRVRNFYQGNASDRSGYLQQLPLDSSDLAEKLDTGGFGRRCQT